MVAYFSEDKRELIGMDIKGQTPLSSLSKDLNNDEYESILKTTDKIITLGEDNNLIFSEMPVIPLPPEVEQLKLLQAENQRVKQQLAQEREDNIVLLTRLDQSLKEILPLLGDIAFGLNGTKDRLTVIEEKVGIDSPPTFL